MKKITLISILIFASIVVSLLAFDTSYKQVDTRQPHSYKPKPAKQTPPKTTRKNIFKHKPTEQADKVQHLHSPNINIADLRRRITYTPGDSGISFSEVSRHRSTSDCYIAINNNVYNVTPYIPYHPAGARIIARYCGSEVTGIFAQIHSNRAWDLLSKYEIGSISAHKQNIMPKVLSALSKALSDANPKATVLKISPQVTGYLAKVIYNNTLYEVHIDSSGIITKEETDANEVNWNTWDTDTDDM